MHDVPYFDRFAGFYDLILPDTDAEPLLSGLDLAEGPVADVVDLGGGTGRAARAISPETVVFDGSHPMLAEARRHRLPTVKGDVRSLPLGTDSIDAAVSVDAIHHFPSLERVLEEASRAIRPGGVLVIRDFDPATLRGRMLVAGERIIGFDSTFASPSDLVSMMGDAGFVPRVLERGFVYTVAATVQ
ncbi:MAG: class I SAM-dependent methyltransferase [Halodesulfurarchaeum sp.]